MNKWYHLVRFCRSKFCQKPGDTKQRQNFGNKFKEDSLESTRTWRSFPTLRFARGLGNWNRFFALNPQPVSFLSLFTYKLADAEDFFWVRPSGCKSVKFLHREEDGLVVHTHSSPKALRVRKSWVPSSSEQKQQMDINNIYLKVAPYDDTQGTRVGKKSIKHICLSLLEQLR